MIAPRSRTFAVWFLLCAGSALAGPGPATPRLQVQPPRDFGYAMGDILEQTFTVSVPAGYALETGYLPQTGALDEYLEVRGSKWHLEQRDDTSVYQVRVAYQIFKGVRAIETATVPALPLRFQGPGPLTATLPEWRFTVAPLIAPDLADEQVTTREAQPPVALPTRPHATRLVGYLGLGAALFGLMAWRRHGSRPHPFARAYRELRRQTWRGATPESYRAAVQRLHQALNETAGHSLFAEQLGGFCAAHPAFAELREELAGFFRLSRRVFFAAPDAPLPPDYPAARLQALCRRCAQAERRQA